MQELVGNLFVWSGLVLFFLQVVLTVIGVLRPRADGMLAEGAGWWEQVFKALSDKFPVAALGIAAVWVGSNILGWWPSTG